MAYTKILNEINEFDAFETENQPYVALSRENGKVNCFNVDTKEMASFDENLEVIYKPEWRLFIDRSVNGKSSGRPLKTSTSTKDPVVIGISFSEREVAEMIKTIYSEFVELPSSMKTGVSLRHIIEQEIEGDPRHSIKIFKGDND